MNPEERADAEVLVDARGLKCPLPVLKLEKALADGPDKGRIVVLATDPVARIDIPHYCRQRGLEVAIEPALGGATRFSVTKT